VNIFPFCFLLFLLPSLFPSLLSLFLLTYSFYEKYFFPFSFIIFSYIHLLKNLLVPSLRSHFLITSPPTYLLYSFVRFSLLILSLVSNHSIPVSSSILFNLFRLTLLQTMSSINSSLLFIFISTNIFNFLIPISLVSFFFSFYSIFPNFLFLPLHVFFILMFLFPSIHFPPSMSFFNLFTSFLYSFPLCSIPILLYILLLLFSLYTTPPSSLASDRSCL